MALTRRYASLPPGEAAFIGMDFSDILPPGQALIGGTLTILTNTNPVQPTTDFVQGPVQIAGNQAWSQVTGGNPGVDYQFRWAVDDNLQNVWQRTALLLCATTS